MRGRQRVSKQGEAGNPLAGARYVIGGKSHKTTQKKAFRPHWDAGGGGLTRAPPRFCFLAGLAAPPADNH
jgi:hypothetical protein